MNGVAANRPAMSRRSFLAASAGAAAACSLTTIAAQAAEDQATPAERYVTNSCRSNCGGKCSLRVTVREGKVVKTEPVHFLPGDEDLERICVKGISQPQRVYDPDRIKYPMKRVEGTERGAGQWERIEWDDAIQMMATEFNKTIAANGPTSLALWTGYGSSGYLNGSNSHGVWSVGYGRFSKAIGTSSFDSAGDWAGVYGAMITGVYYQGCTDDLLGTKTIIMMGADIAETMPGEWLFVKKAMEAGAKLVTVDPRFCITASKSEEWLPIRPGTDGALLLAWCNYIMDNDIIDYEYLRKASVASCLVKEDGTFLRLSDLGMEPVEVYNSTYYMMLPKDCWVVFDEATGTIAPFDYAIQPSVYGTHEVEGVTYKTALQVSREAIAPYTMEFAAKECGLDIDQMERVIRMYAVDKPASFITFNGTAHHNNSHHVHKAIALLVALTGNNGVKGSICLNGGTWRGYLMESQEPATPPNAKEVVKFPGMLFPRAMKDSKIGATLLRPHVVWFNNGNPLANESGRSELVAAVKQADFLVCSDSVMTDTARVCDLVLPIVHPFEGIDIEDTCSTTNGYMHPLAKCIEPTFECRSDMDCYRAVSEAMGLHGLYDKTDEEYLRAAIESDVDLMFGLTYDSVMDAANKGEAVRCPMYLGFSDVKTFDVSTSPSNKIEFYIENPVPRYQTGQTLDINLERIPCYTKPTEAYIENPKSAQYPLLGSNYHSKFSAHSQQAHTPLIREIMPEPMVRMHTSEAEKRGIKTGDLVKVYNDRGYVIIKAEVSEGIRPGQILMRQGWQSDHFVEGHAQDLTDITMNEFCFNSSFNDYICEVEKYKEA